MRDEAEVRRRMDLWERTGRRFRPGRQTSLFDYIAAELRWVLGQDPDGGLRQVTWTCLISEIHDAECTMRREGADLVLETTGGQQFSWTPGYEYEFRLRLMKGTLEPEEALSLPIEKYWILYQEPAESGFAMSANTDLALGGRLGPGLVKFVAQDFDFEISYRSIEEPTKGSRGTPT